MTVTVSGLERVSKEDVMAVIELHWTLVKNVTFNFILNVSTIFSHAVVGKVHAAYPGINFIGDCI